jgi:hypothetical protein
VCILLSRAAEHQAPRVVLLRGALEYQRAASRLSSLDTLLDQEREYLRMEVAHVTSVNPHVLLVERTVARCVLSPRHAFGYRASRGWSSIPSSSTP